MNNAKKEGLNKLSIYKKRDIAKNGMIASIAILTLSGFMKGKTSKMVHVAAGFSLIGFSLMHHSLYNNKLDKNLIVKNKQ